MTCKYSMMARPALCPVCTDFSLGLASDPDKRPSPLSHLSSFGFRRSMPKEGTSEEQCTHTRLKRQPVMLRRSTHNWYYKHHVGNNNNGNTFYPRRRYIFNGAHSTSDMVGLLELASVLCKCCPRVCTTWARWFC